MWVSDRQWLSMLKRIEHGDDAGFAGGATQLSAILEHLAVVEPSHAPRGQLIRIVDQLGRGRGGAVAAIATDAAAEDLGVLARLRRSFGLAVIALIERSDAGAEASRPAADPGVVRVTADRPFRDAWNRAVAAASGGRAIERRVPVVATGH